MTKRPLPWLRLIRNERMEHTLTRDRRNGSSPPIKAIAFDAFGTLIQYGGRRINPYRHFLGGAQSADPSAREPFLTRDVGPETFAEAMGLAHLIPQIQQELATEVAQLGLFGEVVPVLQRARAAGLRVAVVSNLAQAYGPVVRRLLPDLDAYILSYEVGVAKPDPAIFDLACQALGCAPGEVLFTGDSMRCDLLGPQAFGMPARHLDRDAGQTLWDVVSDVL